MRICGWSRPASTAACEHPCDDQTVTQNPPSPDTYDVIERLLDEWLASQLASNPLVDVVERDGSDGQHRWYVRLLGEEKATFTAWFWLRQRNLHVETYFMPAPEENAAALYEHLLRRNHSLHGQAFAIGAEDAVFLEAEMGVEHVDVEELDTMIGSMYAAVEACFRPAMRIGFATRFKG